MKRISVGSWAYAFGPYADHPIPWTEVMANLKALGFDGVEVGGFSIHPRPENQQDKESRARIRQEAEDLGLAFSGYVPNLWSEGLLDTDDHAGYMREFRRGLEFAADLGIKGLCVDSVQAPEILYEVDYGTAMKRAISAWKRCAKEAADLGCYVTWELDPDYAFNKPSDVLRIVEGVNEENFGVQFDTCLAEMSARYAVRQPGQKETLPGGGLDLARKLRGKINHIHLIDCAPPAGEGGSACKAEFGCGILDLDALVMELNRSGVPHDWWTIDLGLWPDVWNVTERAKEFVDRLNARFGTPPHMTHETTAKGSQV